MNLSVTKGPIGISELVYSTTTEQSVECDVMLPDYCPDIVRVLSCQADATLTDTAYMGGRLTLEGMVGLTVFYLSAEGGVRKTDYKLPYSKSIDMKAVEGQPIITASADIAYINCRAVSPRRLDIRGAVAIGVKMWVEREEEAVIDADGEGVQLRRQEVNTCKVVGRMNRQVTQQEDLEVPQGKPAPTQVIRATGCATVSECRSIGGRVVIKGELALRICYATDDICKRFETADYLLPISQIVDAPAAGEDCTCECWLTVCGCSVEVTEDPAGAAIFEVEVDMLAKMTFCENQTVTVATDCYSTRFPCENRVKKVPVMGSGHRMSEKQAFRAAVDVGEDLDSISDVWVKPDKVSCQTTPEGSVVSGKILICILGAMGEEVDYRERQADFEVPLPVRVGTDFTPEVGLSLPAAGLSGLGEMDFKCDIYIGGTAMDGGSIDALADIQMDEGAPFETDPAVGVRIYYTTPGESVWDIAKRYHTNESMIIQDNGLESDHLPERRALIIPSV